MIITALIVASNNGYGADLRSLIEFKENGAIDWTAGVVEAKGTGVPTTYTYSGKQQTHKGKTLSQATKKAQHNLLETIVNLRINSESRVIDVVEAYPSIMAQLRDMVQKAPEVEQLRQYQYDGTVEVWSRMKLNGGFSQLILPPEIRHIESIKQVLTPRKTLSRPRSSQIFTGLVVDARTMRAVPVLAPRILDENLEEVFGPAYVSREFAVQQGMSGYAKELAAAEKNQRVTNNPLTVKGIKTSGLGRSNIVISNADAAKLRGASENLSFMKKCRVMIVVD